MRWKLLKAVPLPAAALGPVPCNLRCCCFARPQTCTGHPSSLPSIPTHLASSCSLTSSCSPHLTPSHPAHLTTLSPTHHTQAAKLADAGVPHKLWVEQPEDFPTCLATAPCRKSVAGPHLRKLQLCKGK